MSETQDRFQEILNGFEELESTGGGVIEVCGYRLVVNITHIGATWKIRRGKFEVGGAVAAKSVRESAEAILCTYGAALNNIFEGNFDGI